MRAAARATSVYAHDEAASLLAMAQRHAVSGPELFEARVRAAQVAEAAGRYADGEALCDQVLESLGSDDVRASLPIRRLRERLRSLLGKPPQQTLAECRLLLAEAERVRDDAERAALLRMISVSYGALGDAENSERLARESVDVAAGTPDKRLHADSLARLGTALIESEPREALARFGEALVLFAQASDRHGQVRCQINSGIAYARLGNEGAAERAYASALTLGRTAHAPDLAGLASLNLGVLHMKGGRFDQARDRFEEALHLFSQVRNERHRLAATYNLAHLARERGDAESARDLYDASARLAGELGLPDVELGAVAGMGLASLAAGEGEAARRWSDAADALLSGREEWWFQGRELVEALGARVALVRGDLGEASERFERGLRRAERGDVYGAAWLVADCAAPLANAGYGAVWAVASEYETRVHQLGFVPLSRRYAALRLDMRRAVPA